MLDKIGRFMERPELFAPSTSFFWNDEHISKYLLEVHLNPDSEDGSRNPEFMDRSADWIVAVAPSGEFPRLLDLGCGPGLYAERFLRLGYDVVGIDASQRSIEYAKEQAKRSGSSIEYMCRDFLSIDYEGVFDVVTLIYYEFSELPGVVRAELLRKIHRALRPGGKFIFDVFTPVRGRGIEEQRQWEHFPDGGFWSEKPHLRLNAFYRYDGVNTVLEQILVVGEDDVECYNMWYRSFTKDELVNEAAGAGFSKNELYGDVSGAECADDSTGICAVLTK